METIPPVITRSLEAQTSQMETPSEGIGGLARLVAGAALRELHVMKNQSKEEGARQLIGRALPCT
jgi:hypothetical protein